MSPILWLLLDLALAAAVVGLGWAAVTSRDLRRGVVLFIAFGLMLALVWARLRAPDLALAEAAIGAGLTGALLLAALRDEPDSGAAPRQPFPGLPAAVALLCLLLAAAYAAALVPTLGIPGDSRLAPGIAARLPDSGVSNPVTAVLLNFRAYDTLLELAVLLAALLGILALGPARQVYQAADPLLVSLVRWLVPLLVVMAGYLLWAGAHAPGGAFQAGATLAAAGVLLHLGGHPRAGLPGPGPLRWLLGAGVGLFLAVGLLLTVFDRAFLEYPRDWAGALILLIETAATLAIAATLTLVYLAGRPPGWDAVRRSRSKRGRANR